MIQHTFIPTKFAKLILQSFTDSNIRYVELSGTDNICGSEVTILKTSLVKCGTLPP